MTKLEEGEFTASQKQRKRYGYLELIKDMLHVVLVLAVVLGLNVWFIWSIWFK